MAEVIGLAASIIQIGGCGAKLSKELYLFINTAARADQDINTIARDVDTTSGVLANVGKVLEADDATKIVNQDAVRHAKDLIKQCEEVFEEILAVLEKRRKVGEDGKKRLSLRGKMSWPMKEQRVELLRRRLETLKSSLLVLFYVLQLAQNQARGDIEKASLEEQRKNIREMHQQQQDSLRILRVLENRLCSVKLDDDDSTLQDSDPPSRTSSDERRPVQVMLATATVSTANDQAQANDTAMRILAADKYYTSESEATSSDEEGAHLTAEELAKCADHVQKLLRRITRLQSMMENGNSAPKCPRRRMHKMYKRFCQRFEGDIGTPLLSSMAQIAPNIVTSGGGHTVNAKSPSIPCSRCPAQYGTHNELCEHMGARHGTSGMTDNEQTSGATAGDAAAIGSLEDAGMPSIARPRHEILANKRRSPSRPSRRHSLITASPNIRTETIAVDELPLGAQGLRPSELAMIMQQRAALQQQTLKRQQQWQQFQALQRGGMGMGFPNTMGDLSSQQMPSQQMHHLRTQQMGRPLVQLPPHLQALQQQRRWMASQQGDSHRMDALTQAKAASQLQQVQHIQQVEAAATQDTQSQSDNHSHSKGSNTSSVNFDFDSFQHSGIEATSTEPPNSYILSGSSSMELQKDKPTNNPVAPLSGPAMQPSNPMLANWKKFNAIGSTQSPYSTSGEMNMTSSFDSTSNGHLHTASVDFAIDPARLVSSTSMPGITKTSEDKIPTGVPLNMGGSDQEVPKVDPHEFTYSNVEPCIGSSGEQCQEVRSLSASDNGWVDLSAHDRQAYDFSDASAITFNPAQSLHLRTSSDPNNADEKQFDASSSQASLSTFEEIGFPMDSTVSGDNKLLVHSHAHSDTSDHRFEFPTSQQSTNDNASGQSLRKRKFSGDIDDSEMIDRSPFPFHRSSPTPGSLYPSSQQSDPTANMLSIIPLPFSRSPSPISQPRYHRRRPSGQIQSTSSTQSRHKSSEASQSSSGNVGLVTSTLDDGRKVWTGVAPNGSSTTRARRGKESTKRRKTFNWVATKAVMDVGEGVDQLQALKREKLLVFEGYEADESQAQMQTASDPKGGSPQNRAGDIVDILLAQWTHPIAP